MEKRYKINEIFYSIQGEGFYTGMPAVFLRFSGCNRSCHFCDTKHEEGKELTAGEILINIAHVMCQWQIIPKVLILTGGEPMLQLDIPLILKLKEIFLRIHIETNGTIEIPSEIKEYLFWITVSPKDTPEELKQKTGNELKVVYQQESIAPWENFGFQHLFLSPCDPVRHVVESSYEEARQNEIASAIREVQKRGGLWRLSVQVQKLLKIK